MEIGLYHRLPMAAVKSFLVRKSVAAAGMTPVQVDANGSGIGRLWPIRRIFNPRPMKSL